MKIYFILFLICFGHITKAQQKIHLSTNDSLLFSGCSTTIKLEKSGFQGNETYEIYEIDRFNYTSKILQTKLDSISIKLKYSTRVFVKAEGSQIISDTISLILKNNDLRVTNLLPIDICNTKSIILNAENIPSGYDIIHWYKDGLLMEGEAQPTLGVHEKGYYNISVSNTNNRCSLKTQETFRGFYFDPDMKKTILALKTPNFYSLYKDPVFILDVKLPVDTKINEIQWFRGDSLLAQSRTKTTIESKDEGEFYAKIETSDCTITSNVISAKFTNGMDSLKIISNVVFGKRVGNQITACRNSFISLEPNETIQNVKWFFNNVEINPPDSSSSFFYPPGVYHYELYDGLDTYYSEKVEIIYGKTEALEISINGNIEGQNCTNFETEAVILPSNSSSFSYYPDYIDLYKNDTFYSRLGFPEYRHIKLPGSGTYHAISSFKFSWEDSLCTFYSPKTKIEFSDTLKYEFSNSSIVNDCNDSLQINVEFVQGLRTLNNYLFSGGKMVDSASNGLLTLKNQGIYTIMTELPNKCVLISRPFNYNPKAFSIALDEKYCNVSHISKIEPLVQINNDYLSKMELSYFNNNILSEDTISDGHLYIKGKASGCMAISNESTISSNSFDFSNIDNSYTLCRGGFLMPEISVNELDSLYWNYSLYHVPIATEDGKFISPEQEGLFFLNVVRNNCLVSSGPISVDFNNMQAPHVKLTGGGTYIYNEQAQIKLELSAEGPWKVKLNDGKYFDVNSSPYLFDIQVIKDTIVSVLEVSNGCGIGTIEGSANISVIILGASSDYSSGITVFPNPSEKYIKIETYDQKLEVINWELYDSKGHISVSGKNSIVNVEHLNSDVYLLKIYYSNDKLKVLKIFKK